MNRTLVSEVGRLTRLLAAILLAAAASDAMTGHLSAASSLPSLAVGAAGIALGVACSRVPAAVTRPAGMRRVAGGHFELAHRDFSSRMRLEARPSSPADSNQGIVLAVS